VCAALGAGPEPPPSIGRAARGQWRPLGFRLRDGLRRDEQAVGAPAVPGPVVEEGTGNGGVGRRAGVGLYFARGEFHGRFGKVLGPVYLRTVRVLGTVSNRRRRRPRCSVSITSSTPGPWWTGGFPLVSTGVGFVSENYTRHINLVVKH
jgi:hypothetical protein